MVYSVYDVSFIMMLDARLLSTTATTVISTSKSESSPTTATKRPTSKGKVKRVLLHLHTYAAIFAILVMQDCRCNILLKQDIYRIINLVYDKLKCNPYHKCG